MNNLFPFYYEIGFWTVGFHRIHVWKQRQSFFSTAFIFEGVYVPIWRTMRKHQPFALISNHWWGTQFRWPLCNKKIKKSQRQTGKTPFPSFSWIPKILLSGTCVSDLWFFHKFVCKGKRTPSETLKLKVITLTSLSESRAKTLTLELNDKETTQSRGTFISKRRKLLLDRLSGPLAAEQQSEPFCSEEAKHTPTAQFPQRKSLSVHFWDTSNILSHLFSGQNFGELPSRMARDL